VLKGALQCVAVFRSVLQGVAVCCSECLSFSRCHPSAQNSCQNNTGLYYLNTGLFHPKDRALLSEYRALLSPTYLHVAHTHRVGAHVAQNTGPSHKNIRLSIFCIERALSQEYIQLRGLYILLIEDSLVQRGLSHKNIRLSIFCCLLREGSLTRISPSIFLEGDKNISLYIRICLPL